MSLADVMHQPRAQIALQRAIASGRIHHAYIFHGPDGVGKETLARGLAEVLLCGDAIDVKPSPGDTDPIGMDVLRVGCGKCDECRAVRTDSHPDFHRIYRQLSREHPDADVRKRKALTVGVDVLRCFLIDKVGLTPARGRTKMFVVREADKMTPQAQNALLKTLEEPPGATVIILLVSALERLLPTTLSRCQVIPFDPLPTEFVRARLAQLSTGLPAEQIEWYARCSDGSLGAALQNAEHQLFDTNLRVVEGLTALARPGDRYKPEQWIEESKSLGSKYRKLDAEISDTEAGRRGLKTIFQMAATCFADILRLRSDAGPALVNVVSEPRIARLAESLDSERAADAINRIARAEQQLDLNVNTQLVVETLLNDLASLTLSHRALGL